MVLPSRGDFCSNVSVVGGHFHGMSGIYSKEYRSSASQHRQVFSQSVVFSRMLKVRVQFI